MSVEVGMALEADTVYELLRVIQDHSLHRVQQPLPTRRSMKN